MKNKMLNKLLQNPSGVKLSLLNCILSWAIPFNAPHGFRLLRDDDGVSAIIPFKRKNLNHIQSIHACALATGGEFCAGIYLLKSFPSTDYRLILSNLQVEYLYQAKTNVICSVSANESKKHAALQEIQSIGKSLIDLETILKDDSQNVVAKVITKWQIKRWDQVRTLTAS